MPPQTQDEKVAFHKRLHKERRYDAYVNKREALKLEGCDPILAWRFAAAYFPPLNGEPHEVSNLPEIPEPEPGSLDGCDYVPDPPENRPKPFVSLPSPPAEIDFPLDGADYTAADIAPPAKPIATAAASTPPAEGDVADDPETEDYSDIKERGEKRIEKIWRRLYRKVPKKRKANPAVVADWIFNNVGADVEEIHHKDVPSRGALSLLRHVQSSPQFYKEFVKETWVKTMPTRQEMMQQDKVGDKHKVQTHMLDAFIQDFEAREAERSRQELLEDQRRT